jgi:ankyrin repeat domain-containing protein 50
MHIRISGHGECQYPPPLRLVVGLLRFSSPASAVISRWTRFSAMADGLSVIASAAGIISLGIQVTQSLVDFYAAYKGRESTIAHTTKKLEHLLDVFESLQQHLAKRKFRADQQELSRTIESSVHDCEECIRELEAEVDKFKDQSTKGIQAAVRTATRRIAYPFRQSTLQKLDEDIDSIVFHLSLALQVLQQKDISKVQDDIEDYKALLCLVRADQISSTIRDWLKAPDATINYNEACKKKHPGTGLWFVRGSVFSAWLVEPNSFLWLNGFAGCGKSVLCSTAIQYTFQHRRSNPRVGIAFFFFTFNDSSKQDTSAMLRALILQLSSQLNDNHLLLSQLHNTYRNSMPPDEALLNCLCQLVQSFENVYILLDALDESPRDKHRGEMLQALVNLRALSEPGLHLLVTSREEPDIRNELEASQEETISMKNDSVDDDITAFISSHLRGNRRIRKWEKYYDKIEASLTERAKGV